MMNSLEVRAPYLDIELVDFARRIPHRFKLAHGQGKYILKKALEPILPARILNRAKKGFGAPIGRWFRDKRLTLPSLDSYPLDPGFAAGKLAEHQAGRADNRLLLWNLWVLGHYQGRA
jgi:asparagine synthase (glutamine-hydrolysing)